MKGTNAMELSPKTGLAPIFDTTSPPYRRARFLSAAVIQWSVGAGRTLRNTGARLCFER